MTGSIPACAGEPLPDLAWAIRTEVYPRVCGGTAYRRLSPLGSTGLSPRVRGNRPDSPPCRTSFRSIPACAGEPAGGVLAPLHVWVYPRVCGGTDICDSNVVSDIRSIPACAGEPHTRRDMPRHIRVYPRVCGGTRTRYSRQARTGSLSPRVRGNPEQFTDGRYESRSIPACAGEPDPQGVDRRGNGVYPRVCGGTCSSRLPCRQGKGLSPRVRGNLA